MPALFAMSIDTPNGASSPSTSTLVRAGKGHEQIVSVGGADRVEHVSQPHARSTPHCQSRPMSQGSPEVLPTCWRSVRRLPAHCSAAVTVRVGKALFSSSIEKERLSTPIPLASIR